MLIFRVQNQCGVGGAIAQAVVRADTLHIIIDITAGDTEEPKNADYAEDNRGYDTPIWHYEPSTPEVPRAAVVIPSITQCGTRTISGTVAFPHLSCGAFLIGDKVSVIGWLRRHESGNNQFVLERVAFVKLERNGQVLFNN